MRHTIAVISILTVVAAAAPAEAKNHHWRYKSRHPHHGGFCGNERPHFHDHGPSDVRLYRVVDNEYYFVGNPVAFGYDGPRYTYYGAHPVYEANVHFGEPVHCYLEGPHYHWYAPPPPVQAQFAVHGGAFWFVGTFGPTYYTHQRHHVVINDAYRPIRYARPAVVIADAPSGWYGRPRGVTPVVVARPAPVFVRQPVYAGRPSGHDHGKGRGNGWKQHDDRGRDHDRGNHDRGNHKGHDKHDNHRSVGHWKR